MIKNTLQQTEPACVLSSYDEFCEWYLKRYDFSMFAESEISQLLEEVKPDIYPCVPFTVGEDNETIFVEVTQVESWFHTLTQSDAEGATLPSVVADTPDIPE
ncbi:hypothetical protein [Enterobacter sp. 22452]|uniref:hypothetical protein n=1 Tax=Enterobacter TaxID=547 RepID=UPI003F85D4AC